MFKYIFKTVQNYKYIPWTHNMYGDIKTNIWFLAISTININDLPKLSTNLEIFKIQQIKFFIYFTTEFKCLNILFIKQI